MDEILFVSGDLRNPVCNYMFKDVLECEKYKSFSNILNEENAAVKMIKRLVFSQKGYNLQKMLKVDLKSIVLDNFISLKSYHFQKNITYKVIIVSTVLEYYPLKYLVYLYNNFEIRFYLVLIDSINTEISSSSKRALGTLPFEKVYSFDSDDCKEFGFQYTNFMYSWVKPKKSSRQRSDIYFVGHDKGRKEMIEAIYLNMKKNGINCDFTINGTDVEDVLDGCYRNRPLTYQDIIDEIQNTNCILEVLQEGQAGVTLRYYEALLYGKKLLTNNQRVKNLPFYTTNQFQVFNRTTDIDVKWLSDNLGFSQCPRDYFSPLKIIQEIETL